MTRTTVVPGETETIDEEQQYQAYEDAVCSQIASCKDPLFTTDISPDIIWETYLSAFPEARRQHYNCHACRRFIQRYGGLVTIDANGSTTSAVWPENYNGLFQPVNAALYAAVAKARVNGVFYSNEEIFGTPQSSETIDGRSHIWTHLSGRNNNIWSGRIQSADQAMAEKVQDYQMLSRGLAEFSKTTVDQALRVLRVDAVDRSEKALGVAEWLFALQDKITVAIDRTRRNNLIWLSVATAPPGFCHIRSTMIGTLLEDIIVGLDFDSISKRWASKMHPLKYQRPTAPPKDGAIDRAEKIVEQLGITKSLARRFARLEDILVKEWIPQPIQPQTKTGGVFRHLRNQPQNTNNIVLPTTTITYEKFKRTVLPDALEIEIEIPAYDNSFIGLVTALDPDAPPIIQWDGLDGFPRNPVSWYYYHGNISCSRWNLHQGWAKVSAIFWNPPHWQAPDKFKHQSKILCFAIEGCQDTTRQSLGLVLFPEIIRSELHEVRSVIEAYSKNGSVTYQDPGAANGLSLGTGRLLRVRTKNGLAIYKVDRLD